MSEPKLTKREVEVTDEYSDMFQEMYCKIRESLELKTIDELREIRNCFANVGKTNCAWTAYGVKELVLADLHWILKEKEKQKESEGLG